MATLLHSFEEKASSSVTNCQLLRQNAIGFFNQSQNRAFRVIKSIRLHGPAQKRFETWICRLRIKARANKALNMLKI